MQGKVRGSTVLITYLSITSKIYPTAWSGGKIAKAIRPFTFVTLTSSWVVILGLEAKICPMLDSNILKELSEKGRF